MIHAYMYTLEYCDAFPTDPAVIVHYESRSDSDTFTVQRSSFKSDRVEMHKAYYLPQQIIITLVLKKVLARRLQHFLL